VTFMPEATEKPKQNLISGSSATTDKQVSVSTGEARLLMHWSPELNLRVVDDHSVYPHNALPPQLLKHMQFDRNGNYYPVVHVHDFWITKSRTTVVNETVTELPLTLTLAPLGTMWWQLFVSMDQSFSMHEEMGTMQGDGKDEFKKILLEGNPILLGVTFMVSILHSVFDMLAFKNDISFWRKVKSMEGLSVRTVFLNVVCQGIILLYLFDRETSWMILISSSIGLVIEIWKVNKACDVHLGRWHGIPYPVLDDKKSYSSNKTKTYDDLAVRYLSWVVFPVIFGYSLFSVFYLEHKGWYSWIIGTAVGCVYTFGFIMMTPQLFINYKLKSVAHMAWRPMMYKFLNTIIDDLFAFVITMPTMHRLACFRDDLVFLVALYQRWIYRVDMTRVNEFGQVGDDKAKQALDEQHASPPTPAIASS